MNIDPAILSSVSALLGALIGGGASLCAAIHTQRYKNRLQRVAGEIAKRETGLCRLRHERVQFAAERLRPRRHCLGRRGEPIPQRIEQTVYNAEEAWYS
jgi:hypothetical protein